MIENSREKILFAATKIAQAHGYNGLNFRDLARRCGHQACEHLLLLPGQGRSCSRGSEALLGERLGCSRYTVGRILRPGRCPAPLSWTFRWALENENRMCLSGFMAAEYDDLPEAVKKEIQTFADVNVAWLSKVLSAAKVVSPKKSEPGHGLSSLRSAAHSSWRGAARISRSMTR